MSETSSDVGAKKRHQYPTAFEDWWRAYPRHKNASKKQALESWRKATRQIDAEQLLSLTRRYSQTHGVSDESKIPHPTTWLNQERWETVDEHDAPAPRKDPNSLEAWLTDPGDDNNSLQAWLGSTGPVVDAEFWEEQEVEK